jgi:hypothetical protein
MPTRHIRLLIRTDGSCTIDAEDFADATCTQANRQCEGTR